MKEWFVRHKGYCIIIGGPGFCSNNSSTSKYFVRCFGFTPFRGNNSSDCMINALGNLFFIFLGEDKASELFNRLLPQCIASASQRHRRHTDGKLEVSGLMKLGHLGYILQDAGGYLGLRKLSVPLQGHKENPDSRFNRLFEKYYYGRVVIVRLFEAGVVDHVVAIDSPRWS